MGNLGDSLKETIDKIENELESREFNIRFCLKSTLCGLTWNQAVRDAFTHIIETTFRTVHICGPEGETWPEIDRKAIEKDIELLQKYLPEPITKN